MAAMPIYGKIHFANLLLQNQKAGDLWTWYVAFGMWDLPSLFKKHLNGIFFRKVDFFKTVEA